MNELFLNNKVLAGKVDKTKKSFVQQTKDNSKDVLTTAKKIKLPKSDKLPWESDQKGKLYSTLIEKLNLKCNYFRVLLGLKTKERTHNFVDNGAEELSVNEDPLGSFSNLAQLTDPNLRAAAANELMKYEGILFEKEQELKFHEKMQKWATGFAKCDEYEKCFWVKQDYKDLLSDLNPNSSVGLSQEQLTKYLDEYVPNRSLISHYPNLINGFLSMKEKAKEKTYIFMKYLENTIPKTDEEMYLYYKYVVLGKPVDFNYLFLPSKANDDDDDDDDDDWSSDDSLILSGSDEESYNAYKQDNAGRKKELRQWKNRLNAVRGDNNNNNNNNDNYDSLYISLEEEEEEPEQQTISALGEFNMLSEEASQKKQKIADKLTNLHKNKILKQTELQNKTQHKDKDLVVFEETPNKNENNPPEFSSSFQKLQIQSQKEAEEFALDMSYSPEKSDTDAVDFDVAITNVDWDYYNQTPQKLNALQKINESPIVKLKPNTPMNFSAQEYVQMLDNEDYTLEKHKENYMTSKTKFIPTKEDSELHKDRELMGQLLTVVSASHKLLQNRSFVKDFKPSKDAVAPVLISFVGNKDSAEYKVINEFAEMINHIEAFILGAEFEELQKLDLPDFRTLGVDVNELKKGGNWQFVFDLYEQQQLDLKLLKSAGKTLDDLTLKANYMLNNYDSYENYANYFNKFNFNIFSKLDKLRQPNDDENEASYRINQRIHTLELMWKLSLAKKEALRNPKPIPQTEIKQKPKQKTQQKTKKAATTVKKSKKNTTLLKSSSKKTTTAASTPLSLAEKKKKIKKGKVQIV